MDKYPITDSEGPEVVSWGQYLQLCPRDEQAGMIRRLSSDGIETLSSPSCENTLIGGQSSPAIDSTYSQDNQKQGNSTAIDEKSSPGSEATNKRYCGMSKAMLIVASTLLLGVLVSLGVALGITLSRKNASSHDEHLPVGQSTNGSPDQQMGAFNGSGIAVAGESFDAGGHGETVLYFQHKTGQIRSTQLQSDGTWQGGSISEVVATDAKNATPISAVSYSINGTNTWHIFYIGLNNTILERVNDNNTNTWRDGPISRLALQAMDDRNVGLQACWYGNYYGAASYNKSRTRADMDTIIGMHLWYGAGPTSLNQVVWVYGEEEWTEEKPFDGFSGHAGIGCFSWGDDSITYVMLVNPQAELEVWWKDLNTSSESFNNHPINTWQNSSVTIPHLQPNTSLGYTDYLFVQHEDNSIGGYNISWAAENSTIIKEDTFTITDSRGQRAFGQPGTHLTNTALPNKSGGASVYAFFQMNGTDVVEYQRDLNQGQWFSSNIPIPPL